MEPGTFLLLMTYCQSAVLTVATGKGESTLAETVAMATEIGLPKQAATQIIKELTENCAGKKMEKFKLR